MYSYLQEMEKMVHTCERCGKLCGSRQVLHRHIQSMHSEKRLCWYCDYSNTRPYMMRNHLTKNHPHAPVHGSVKDLFRSERDLVRDEPVNTLFATSSAQPTSSSRPPVRPPPQVVVARCRPKVKSKVVAMPLKEKNDMNKSFARSHSTKNRERKHD